MKVGDYVRFKTLSREIKIGKVIDIIEPDNSNELSLKNYNVYDLDNNEATVDDYIIKSSPNIIDLIEVGDVIVGKDNHKFEVYAVGSDCVYINELKEFILVKDIKGIVTKEQFESMEYKIGE